MSDHELDPPPERPLPPERRQAMRSQLLAAADTQSPSGRGWLVPGLAAAAVATILIGGAVAVRLNDSGGPGSPQEVLPGASKSVSATVATQAPASSAEPTSPPSSAAATRPPSANSPMTIAAPTEPAPELTGPAASASCEQEVSESAEPGLRDATVTAERDYGAGTTYLYETKSAWVVCDALAAAGSASPTLLATHQKSQPYEPDKATLAISENPTVDSAGDQVYSQFLAAGRDFDGVQDIAYHFPDGHTQDAVVGQNGLWSMTYLPTEGVLADPEVNHMHLDPIWVSVRLTGGDVRSFTLSWGLDTCAQTNHGC